MPHKHNERTQIRYRQMREMWEQGWTDGKIADELGISKHTVKRWRLGECLQPNKARKEVV
jgi:DNA-binding NarL/FixJ family response regulator